MKTLIGMAAVGGPLGFGGPAPVAGADGAPLGFGGPSGDCCERCGPERKIAGRRKMGSHLFQCAPPLPPLLRLSPGLPAVSLLLRAALLLPAVSVLCAGAIPVRFWVW